MRLIDADQFILALMDAALSSADEDTILDLVDSISTVDAVPVVHGHSVDVGGVYARCSQCDGVLPLCANYCPNCGAKMDGGAGHEAG